MSGRDRSRSLSRESERPNISFAECSENDPWPGHGISAYSDTDDSISSLVPMGYTRNMDDTDDENRGFVFYSDPNGNRRMRAVWIEPEIDDPILVLERKWAELLVSGIKTLELRNYFLRKFKSNDRIWIAAKAGKAGRRAYPSPLGPDHDPQKSEILGSVCFSYQNNIYPDEFDVLYEQHRVEDRDMAPQGKLVDGERVLRGWYFGHAVKAPYPRQYRIERGSQSWRKFKGWM